MSGPLFFIPLIPLFFKYHTLKYTFDDSGISMSWGILFRREVYLTYRRIQDIHLSRGLIQRWLGLATVAIQTAAGSARPEMSIEGILEADKLRDHLYTKMRGAARKSEDIMIKPIGGGAEIDPVEANEDQVLEILKEIRDHLQNLTVVKSTSDKGGLS
ncbi:MAG: PH domain-containing protein [Desulfatiglans sp.]|nr:PH domain-containing protein [Desulfatiglans sp.]